MSESFDKEANSPTGVGANIKLIEDLANSMRRMKANEEFDPKGVRTIWHRGRRAELLSWENREGQVLRQELSFLGLVVEFKGGVLKTGEVPMDENSTSGNSKMSSNMVQVHPVPDAVVLDYASALLKGVPGRDFYAQHLLKHVNDTIGKLGFDDARTAVSKLDGFAKTRKNLPTMTDVTKTMTAPPTHNRFRTPLLFGILALAGVGLGLLAGHFLFR